MFSIQFQFMCNSCMYTFTYTFNIDWKCFNFIKNKITKFEEVQSEFISLVHIVIATF